jgi:hypothetical protein
MVEMQGKFKKKKKKILVVVGHPSVVGIVEREG